MDVIRTMETTSKRHRRRSFLGCVSFYRRFIKDFSTIAHPLTQLTCKNAQFVWTDECRNSFNTLRDALVSSPVLAAFDPTKDVVFQSDASGFAVGAVLLQPDKK